MRNQYSERSPHFLNDGIPVVYGSIVFPNEIGFDDKNERKKFITKVYLILWIQLMFTSVFMGICNQVTEVSDFMMSLNGAQLGSLSILILFVLSIMMFCCDDYLKKSPMIYLLLFTCSVTYLMGFIGLSFSGGSLLLVGITTLFIFMTLTLYAIQTTVDYTISGNILLILLSGLVLFSFIISFTDTSIFNTTYSVIGSIIFSFYIVYDTQLIVGGGHRKIHFTPDDVVLAVISLYLDIINLFLCLLGDSSN